MVKIWLGVPKKKLVGVQCLRRIANIVNQSSFMIDTILLNIGKLNDYR